MIDSEYSSPHMESLQIPETPENVLIESYIHLACRSKQKEKATSHTSRKLHPLSVPKQAKRESYIPYI